MMAELRKLRWPMNSTPLVNNYEEFIGRLDAAGAKLRVRRDNLDKTIDILSLLFRQNNTGHQLWEQRLNQCTELLASGGASGRRSALIELHEVAIKMEPLFRNRTQRIEVRLTDVRTRRADINDSLSGLEKSRLKLTSSRMLSQERENLSRAIGELSGTADVPSVVNSDRGLHSDLQDARQAILMAEALLEAKGEK